MGRQCCKLFEDVSRDHTTDLSDVGISLELEFCGETVGERQDKLAIRDKLCKSGGLMAKNCTLE